MTSFKSGPGPFGGVKRTFLGHYGPVLTIYMAMPGTGYRILDTSTPGKGIFQYARRAKSNMGPKTVKSDLFQKLPQTLWGGETDVK